MFDNFKIANYSNSLVSPELYARHFSRLITGNVIDGLTLVPKTGLTVTLQPGNALISYGSGATASARMVSLVADFDITLSTADASNPRIDSIVCYVDTTVFLPGGTPTSANLDGPGVWKAVKVNGTPNASPVAPNSTAIQTAIGAGKPYFVAHDVRIDAGVTTIASNKITDRRTLAAVSLAAVLAPNIPAGTLTNSMFSTATGEVGAAWKSYTPTWTASTSNPNIGNGTLAGHYMQIGKTIHFRILILFGSTTTAGSGVYSYGLPVTAATSTSLVTSSPIGSVFCEDVGVESAAGVCTLQTPTTARSWTPSTTKSVGLTSNVYPYAFGNGDAIRLSGTYEAA
ncbi:hypothetical protein [Rhodococcus aetherivorans]|uniref:hypothetical protein n=1 Tax=Rhodococcus aetherivorans TaxID=191292 RepID=UPI00294A8CFB|nr:hypothetical protein [Rhodococcus aetherivorans]MDV6295175.1 hypothetical protein [Rhodococcus aetherivorans]